MGIIKCVLVVKKTVLNQDRRASRLARTGDRTASRLIEADREHNLTADVVREELSRRQISFVEIVPHSFTPSEKRKLAAADLVVTVGGDGTILGASHYVRQAAMMGVNSAPKDSIGHFCYVDRRDFGRVLDAHLESKGRPFELARLAVSLDGNQLPELVLNDVLIAHQSPAATTRYILEIGGVAEEQRSSGIWISTAAGSTAAIRSAGGRRLPIESKRYQYLVRELYREHGREYRLVRGVLGPNDELMAAAKMPEGRIFLDGSRTVYRFPYGMRATIKNAGEPLRIYLRGVEGEQLRLV